MENSRTPNENDLAIAKEICDNQIIIFEKLDYTSKDELKNDFKSLIFKKVREKDEFYFNDWNAFDDNLNLYVTLRINELAKKLDLK